MRFRAIVGVRSLALVIAIVLISAPTHAPVTARQVSEDGLDELIATLDNYWTGQFASRDFSYSTPEIEREQEPRDRDCRAEQTATYCTADDTLYVDEAALGELLGTRDAIVGITVLAFAWGAALGDHLADLGYPAPAEDPAEQSLFAACAAGVFVGHLWFDYATSDGDLIIAVETVGALAPGNDPTTDALVLAFMSGFVVGLDACLELSGLSSPE